MSTMKLMASVAIMMLVSVVAVIANQVGGTEVEVGETYKASYTYCGAWAGVGGTRHCSLYLSGTETRIKTEVKGLWWDTESYHVK